MKFFGKQDIKVGDKEFDKKYLIHSNEPGLITNILNYKEISKMLLKHNISLVTLDYDKKDAKQKLMIIKDRNTNKKEILIELINLEFSMIDFFIDNNLIRN